MKKVGLVGGISWVSTLEYYRAINEQVNTALGGLQAAECMIYSLNFSEIQERGWVNAYDLLLEACRKLKEGGVDAIALCANTAHLFADELQEEIRLPLIHIGTATAAEVKKSGLKKIGLLGTKFTMEMEFYRSKLEDEQLEVLIPEPEQTRDYIQQTLKEELGIGLLNPATKAKYLNIMQDLIARGAEGIILGCTEIPLLLGQKDVPVPVFDTTLIHTRAIVEFIVS